MKRLAEILPSAWPRFITSLAKEDDPGFSKAPEEFEPDPEDEDGRLETSEASEALAGTAEALPKTFAFHGNYPNPFNPVTTITVDLPEPAKVSVEIFDMLGRRILVMPVRTVEAGANRTLEVDASRLVSGVYLYRVVARTQETVHVATGQMVLVK